MERLPAIISVGILGIVGILMGCFYKKILPQYRYFLAYCVILFCYEAALLITALMHIDNHWIANLNTLLYGIISLLLLSEAYKKYHRNIQSLKMILIAFLFILSTGWIIENFTMDKTFFVYNSKLAGIMAVFSGLVSIYLLNVLAFAKSGNLLKYPDALIIIALLIRSITFGFSLWFLNFDYGFDIVLLSNLLTGINVGLCVSDLFLLLAVQKISTTAKEMVKVK